jgi:chemotaxis family two-component system response regulator Rcp1
MGLDELQRPREILLVEDNPADAYLVGEALKGLQVPTHLSVAGDGRAALAVLRHEGPYTGTDTPDLILLDLNLPHQPGLEILAEVKADPFLRHIPVLVLTTSQAPDDIVQSYELGANSYLTKPFGLDAFLKMMQALEEFWLVAATLPPPLDRAPARPGRPALLAGRQNKAEQGRGGLPPPAARQGAGD